MSVNQQFTQMPFISSVREAILESLSKGPTSGTALLALVNKLSAVSKQGLYKSLRELLREEIIIKNKRIFYLNKVWLARLREFVDKGEQGLGVALPFLETSFSGHKVITFKNMESLDIFWGHLFLALAEQFPDKPFFFFNHHNWSVHSRPYSELYLYNTSIKMKGKILITLGANTVSEKDFKKRFGKENVQIAIDEKTKISKTEHLCVVGDYFITTKYDKETMSAIDTLFRGSSTIDEKDLSRILIDSKSPKMVIVKNKQKALVWKQRLAKNFIVKKSDF